MHIIPVIDICRGQAVHAIHGQRQEYQPINSRLCAGSEPHVIVQALIDLYPFTTLYIADLDAICGNGDNNRLIGRLHQRFTGMQFWVDAGHSTLNDLSLTDSDNITPVIGTETGIHPDQLQQLLNHKPQPVLSLDFKAGTMIGNPAILHHSEFWPDRVIAMNLSAVGSKTGPDLEWLTSIMARAKTRSIYCAGGIRDSGDLHHLNSLDVTGALLATALHNGQISHQDISAMK